MKQIYYLSVLKYSSKIVKLIHIVNNIIVKINYII